MSLYSKYRPQNFANLVGQDHIRQTLLHEIQQGTLTHAYLFAGPRGTGKTSTARLIAKALNCEKKSPEGEPCEKCDFCKTITEGSLIDVMEIDAASNRGIDEIRDLKEKIKFAPTRAKTKIYIIDEIHMLTKEAFNALLKTLEEPPENVYFIVCTTEIHKIPETIISRCQRFDFKRIDVRTIMTRLSFIAQNENIESEDAAIELIARHVEGGLRDAIGLLEQLAIDKKLLADHVRSHLGITGHTTVETLIDLLEKKELAKTLHLINEVHNEGYDLTAFVREILECLRSRLITDIQQGKIGTGLWLAMIDRFEEARDMLRSTVIPQLPLEIAAIKICESDTIIDKPIAVQKGAPTETPLKMETDKAADEHAKKEETQTAAKIKQEFEMEAFKGDIGKHWPRVLEHIQPPSLRRSLADAHVSEPSEGNIALKFNSRFHMEKVNLAENRVKIEKALEHLFGKKWKITCTFEGQAKESSLPVQERKTAPAKEKKPAADIIEKAMEIFGNDE
ncbi:DNA polymerase III subunit gamma/tau [Candidatus Peregrinibacteria bacterium]|nr:DNA polymerase III subunit gamma/tau [Candidatus Peregrinibacteria bacterium]